MIYIKLDQDMNLAITVNEPIYRGDNLKEKLTFLIPVNLGEIDMMSAFVYLNYIRADGTPDVTILQRGEDMYNESYYQFYFPVTCTMTRYPGEVMMWLQIFDGNVNAPKTAKSSECILHITDSKNMDDFLADRQVTMLYQLHKMMTDEFERIDESLTELTETKADNAIFDPETGILQLTANIDDEDVPIGDPIQVITYPGIKVVDAEISEDDELIIYFDDGTEKNIGKITSSEGVVYVPHVDENNILTFTIEEHATEVPDPVNLNPSGINWNNMDDSDSDGGDGTDDGDDDDDNNDGSDDGDGAEPTSLKYVWKSMGGHL